MSEDNTFKSGSTGGDQQNKPTKEDSERKDEYGNNTYKCRSSGMSEQQLFGTDQLPVQDDPLPAKGLKSVGG